MRGPIVYEAPRPPAAPGETVVTSTCGHNCGGRCVVNAHVRDGRIVRISTDPRKWTPEVAPLHACVRGFGQLERLNHPDRVVHPLRRVGPRGGGQFERIGWDEFFKIFDQSDVAFLHGEGDSRFNKFVAKESAES